MSERQKRRETRSGGETVEPSEWAGLYRQFHTHLRSWFAARVATQQDADDLAEEVLAQLRRRLTPDGRKAYVKTAAANALSRYRRRRAREREALRRLLAGASRAGDTSLTRDSEKPSDDDEAVANHKRIEEILRTLPPEQAKLLTLRFVDGLTVAEVALRVGCSREAAYKRLQRIIQRLRDRYGVEPDGPGKPRK